MHWLETRRVVPAIIDFQQAAQQLRESELERARRMLARGEDPERVLEQLAHGLTQKYMHGPLSALNQSDTPEREQLLTLLPRLLPSTSRRR
jgi:glutamyl-tRNA reductase